MKLPNHERWTKDAAAAQDVRLADSIKGKRDAICLHVLYCNVKYLPSYATLRLAFAKSKRCLLKLGPFSECRRMIPSRRALRLRMLQISI